MVDSPLFELFQDDSVDKQLKIEFDGGVITNVEIHTQQFELEESLCSESELRFGSCEASSIKFKISNVFTPLKDKWLTASMTLDGNTAEPFLIGKYKVYSDVPTADRRYREVSAYDAMYDIINSDVADWYNSILPEKTSTVTLKQFRTSFISYFGLTQEEIDLVNDGMTIEKTIEPSEISGKDVITAICEINGCFGHIGRDGKFQYIHLKEMVKGLYPRNDLYPRDDLYPAEPMNSQKISRSHYISAEYEDFKTERINKLQIRQEENDIGCIYGSGDNCYIVQDNFLVYGKSSDELRAIASDLYFVICKVWYRPASVEAKGNLCLEVGDGIRLNTKYEIIYTYILRRMLKGILALRDTYEAEGERYQAEKVNSAQNSIIQLKGKTNTLIRTVEETKLEIKDVERGLTSDIIQTASEIRTEIEDTKNGMQSSITQTADSIKSEVSATYETKKDAETNYSNLSSRITQTADSITAEVNRAQGQETELAAAVSIQADQIKLKVSQGSVSSEISQESGKISINSNRISIDSTYFKLTEDGKITATDVDLSGKIKSQSGKIGGFTISSNALYTSSASSIGGSGVHLGNDGFSVAGILGSAEISNNGEAEFKTDGDSGVKITNKYNSSVYSYIKPNGITIKNSTYTDTEYTEKTIKAYSRFLMTFYDGLEIDLTSVGTRTLTIKGAGTTYAEFAGVTSYIYGGTLGVCIGKTGNKLGFFGDTGNTKKTVSKISSTTSATASTVATVVNNLIDALKAYNLIG